MSPLSPSELPLTEKEFQSNVVEMAHTCGWVVAHFGHALNKKGQYRTPAWYDAAGFPDLLIVDPARGRVFFRELKADRGRLTDRQQRWQDVLTESGCDAAVWRPRDWPKVVSFLSRGKARIA